MEDNGSLYDQFSGIQPPAQPPAQKKVREINWQSADNARREEALKQKHVTDAMEIEQKDNSKMAWWRLFTGQIPKCNFEREVNSKYGGKPQGKFDYKEKRAQYISFYKQAMSEL